MICAISVAAELLVNVTFKIYDSTVIIYMYLSLFTTVLFGFAFIKHFKLAVIRLYPDTAEWVIFTSPWFP